MKIATITATLTGLAKAAIILVPIVYCFICKITSYSAYFKYLLSIITLIFLFTWPLQSITDR